MSYPGEESATMTGRTPVPFLTKLNPLWWLVGPDGWTVPDINNGQPYLPDVENIWLRRFYWFVCRNPLMNFVGFVIGVEDKNYQVFGSEPVLKTTGRDCEPPQTGWRWAVIETPFSWLACAVMMTIALVWGFLLASSAWWLLLLPAVMVSILRTASILPFVSFWGPSWFGSKWLEFYLGWRPASGGFGVKFVLTDNS